VQRYLVPLLLAASTNFAPAAASEECNSALCRVLATGRLEGLRWPDFSDCRRTLEEFYRASGNALVWTRNGSVTPQAAMMIDAIQNSAAKELDPEDYDGSTWPERFAPVSSEANEEQLARFDVAASVAVIRFVRALHVGKFNPGRFLRHWFGTLRLARPGANARQAGDVKTQLVRIDPPFEAYRRAERALERYRALARGDQRRTSSRNQEASRSRESISGCRPPRTDFEVARRFARGSCNPARLLKLRRPIGRCCEAISGAAWTNSRWTDRKTDARTAQHPAQ